MNDEIDELLADWYSWEAEYSTKLGYDRASASFRDHRSRWADSEDLSDKAHANARKQVCEAVGMCVQKLDLRYRIAIQTVMRDRYSGSASWHSIRLQEDPYSIYEEGKKAIAPILYAKDLIENIPA